MSRPKTPEIPQAPSFQADPFATQGIGSLLNLGGLLTGGAQFDPSSQIGFLNPLVSFGSGIAQQGIDLATRNVERLRERAQQDIVNQLEANNQLTSSVAVNRLSDLNEEFSRDISDIATRFSLAEAQRAQGASERLFGLGLGATGQAGQLGLQRENLQNQFNLQNFSNIVARANAQQRSGRGGLFGGLLGTAVGAIAKPFGLDALAAGGLGGALGSGFGELISPSQQGDVAAGFGTRGLGALQLNEILNRTSFPVRRNDPGFGGSINRVTGALGGLPSGVFF